MALKKGFSDAVGTHIVERHSGLRPTHSHGENWPRTTPHTLPTHLYKSYCGVGARKWICSLFKGREAKNSQSSCVRTTLLQLCWAFFLDLSWKRATEYLGVIHLPVLLEEEHCTCCRDTRVRNVILPLVQQRSCSHSPPQGSSLPFLTTAPTFFWRLHPISSPPCLWSRQS